MPAVRLGRASIATNVASSVAVGAVIALGTVLVTALATLLETGLHHGDRGVLVMLPAILGSWAVGIVAYGVASVVSVSVAARSSDLALLRAVAATPGQVRRIVLVETLMIATPAVLVGLVPGLVFGSLLLDALIDARLVDSSVTLSAGLMGLVVGGATATLTAAGAAWIAGRGPSRVSPVAATRSDGGSTRRRGDHRKWGSALVLLGISLSVTTSFMPNGPVLSSTAGPAAVATSIGLSLFAPMAFAPLRRWTAGGPMFRLAMHNVHARRASGGLTTPVILLVGIATSTLAMQRIDDGAPSAVGSDGVQLAPINYVVVAMLIGFTAILVVTGVITSLQRRREEFDLLRIAVATRSQVAGVVAIETIVVTGVAIILGCVAAATAIIPFALVRIGSPVSIDAFVMYPLIIVTAAAIVAVTTSAVLRSSLSTRAAVA